MTTPSSDQTAARRCDGCNHKHGGPKYPDPCIDCYDCVPASGETAVPAQAVEERSEENAMGDDGLTEHCGCCGHRRAPGQCGGPLCACTLDGLEFMTREAMAMVVPTLVEEYRRAEGDLGVAVHEATTARAECGKWLRAAGELAAQRQAVLDLCDQTRAGTSTFPIDCTNNCYDSDCDCSGKFRPLSWKLDPDAIRSALGVGAATGTKGDPECGCSRCDGERRAAMPWPARISGFMILCPECGNKRCPRAAWHGNACTGSNAPGQPGSNYPATAVSGTTPTDKDDHE